MLKLKKIQILGFKSFCDKTEVVLPGHGIAAVVGPNGCGKSNILDGVTWVLGEQSAKTLRGGQMQDVIFAGSRDRKALGMAEVTLTMVDPEAYGGPLLEEPEIVIDNNADPDWDEEKLREQRASEVEEIIAESQPGQSVDGEAPSPELAASPSPDGNPVVLKIRRRKFQKTPQQGEIIVTRRLFRTGESEYLLNGKLCRLRDIQDIFMGTGLGPESYAIIGQERIGQLLSSKPHDRRSIIEEAAGITRFKTKKRLAELRLESAKQNLARVNDIFEEVTRQMASLKRQAAKAERYGAIRDELRTKLRVVLASRIRQMDAEQTKLTEEITAQGTQIDEHAAKIEILDAEHQKATSRGYELDNEAKEAQTIANNSAIELERATSRQRANTERISELEARKIASTAELEQTRQQIDSVTQERVANKQFLETAAQEATAFREQSQAKQQSARHTAQQVNDAEQRLETSRRQSMHLLTQAGIAHNQTAQAEEALAALEREAESLASEMSAARQEMENLGAERSQVSMRFESATEALKRLEQEIAELRRQINVKREEESQAKRQGDKLRAEHATLLGRRNSLDGLIREHSYSTETVKKLFRSKALNGGLAPVGTLADFLEVNGAYENVVDEFLREELNYIVVKSWDAADQGMHLLKTDVDGRATFLVHPEDSQAKFSFVADGSKPSYSEQQGIVRLKDCIRVLDGFGSSLEVILPKLREGYVTPDADTARSLALENPHAFFLSPSGECFHNVTVTGGKPRAEGPLALKRELREAQEKLSQIEASLAESEAQAAALSQVVVELSRLVETKSDERRDAERESANQGAALRQLDAEVQRLQRRVQEREQHVERNNNTRQQRQALIAQKREEATRLETQHAEAEAKLEELQKTVEELRHARESAQQEAAQVSAELAGLEERRRGAESSFARIDRLHADLERRAAQLEQQLAAAVAEREQRAQENESLGGQHQELAERREAALRQVSQFTEEAKSLRSAIAENEQQLKVLRSETDTLREARSERTARSAKLKADIEYMEAACVSDLGIEATALREEELTPLEDEALAAEDEICRGLKQKLEAMGPVNMMALEEYKETAERHTFLETQRKDLLDSIENTQSTIKEIDQISRTKFDEAFARINENFAATFTRLFNGGQAFMKLTDEENSAESGIDLVASPPGKKPQNVLLLSGGEKALTALSLLVGIFQYQPSPFCVLDEVDAPLDETNVGRLADLLRSMSHNTQFVMVTHSKRMMTAADLIYGVTMQEPGCSKLVSVRLGNSERSPEPSRATA
jgi:chromosome segregation protein